MPNYCNNSLSVKSENFEEIKVFFNNNKTFNNPDNNDDSFLSFSKSVPKPEEEDDWYNWNIKNWGTKWDAIDVDLNNVSEDEFSLEYTNELIYSFTTAWGPALSWLESVAKKYPKLCFENEYSECGMDLYGKRVYSNGELIEDVEMSLSEFNWEKVDKELLLQLIKEKIDTDEGYQVEDLAEEILEEYANKDEYLDNIESYVEKEIDNYILENQKNEDCLSLNYDNEGNKVDMLEF